MQQSNNYIHSRLRIFWLVKNWPILLADYFSLIPEKEYVVTLWNGVRLILRSNTTDKWSIHEIVLRDDYQIQHIPDGTRVIMDLGANVGEYALFVAQQYPHAHVYAFEPEPKNYAVLNRNVFLNHQEKRVTISDEAITSKSGTSFLSISTDIRSHSLSKQMSKTNVAVKTMSLPQMMKRYSLKRIDVLKMDIEGSEYDILYSLPTSLFSKIRTITMEYHNQDQRKKNGKYLKQFLIEKGFVIQFHEAPKGDVGSIYAIQK